MREPDEPGQANGGLEGATKRELATEFVRLAARSGQPFVIPACGGSMGRLLRGGGDIVVRPCDRPLRFGDVIVFRSGSECIAHRIVGLASRGGGYVITKGDRRARADTPPVPLSDVLGLAVGVLRNGHVCVPWTWRWPVSLGAGVYSRLHGAVLSPAKRRMVGALRRALGYDRPDQADA